MSLQTLVYKFLYLWFAKLLQEMAYLVARQIDYALQYLALAFFRAGFCLRELIALNNALS